MALYTYPKLTLYQSPIIWSIPLFSLPIFSPYFRFCNNLFTFLDMNNMFPFFKRFFKVIGVMLGPFISIALTFFSFVIQSPNAILDQSHQYCQFWRWSKPSFNCTSIVANGWNVNEWKPHFLPHFFPCFLTTPWLSLAIIFFPFLLKWCGWSQFIIAN